MIKHHTVIHSITIFLADLLAVLAAFVLAHSLRGCFAYFAYEEIFPLRMYMDLFFAIFPLWFVSFYSFGLYEYWRGPGFWAEFWTGFKAILLSFLVFSFIILFLRYQFVSRIFLLFFFLFNIFLMPFFRWVARRVLIFLKRKNGDDRYYLIVGTDERAGNFARQVEKHRDLGLRILGFVSPDQQAPSPSVGGYPVLGNLKDLENILENRVVDEVILAIPQEELHHMGDLFLLCEERGITARVVLDFFPHNIARTRLDELDGISLLTFSTTPKSELLLFTRRLFDFLVSLLLIALFSPLFLLVWLFIRVESPGPALYRQTRVGLNGRKFVFYKFRSMVQGAEDLKDGLAGHNLMNGPVFKMENDPRITRIGRLLRKSSLDELPQLFNVLKGEMSLVGPRPNLPEEVAQYQGWQRRRLSMKPGITGLWQVSGRNLIDFNDWMRLDLAYIDNWSLWLDFKILLKTIPTILGGKGAM
jgi:exopolysaccharide biosynthesis polyprenyl glycosylphosphotransferase